MPLSADGSKLFKSYLQKKLFSLPDSHSAKPFFADVAGNHVMAAGINPDTLLRPAQEKNRWLNLGRKQVPKTYRKVG